MAGLTIAQALHRARESGSNLQGLDRLDAQLLMLHALGRPPHDRAWLLAHDTDLLGAAELAAFEDLADRRFTGEPVAYITGRKEFFGLDLLVDSRVLVPRPDTETLVSWALEALSLMPSARAAHHPSALDLGTGSGAVALALKSAHTQIQVIATDASHAALEVARANSARLNLDVGFCSGSWFDALPPDRQPFDLIVSNPPYIAEQDSHLEALWHEPRSALTAGADGLDDIRQIIAGAGDHLLPGGWLLLEHGFDQAPAVRGLLDQAGFGSVQSRNDLSGIARCSGGQKRAR